MNRGYGRAYAWVAAVWLIGCAGDDTDPNSDTCKKLRAQYDEAKLLRDQAASYGPWGDTQVTDVLLTQFVNKHWGCFH